jgi:glycosyltransferase involved in cell wall biosynthesis
MKKALEWVSVVHVMSDISKKIVQDIYPIDEERIFKSTWGIDTDFFNPDRNTESISEKLGLEDEMKILSFRALEPLYRIDLLLRAFKIVQEKHPNVQLILGNDGSEKEKLSTLSKELDIDENVVFTGRLSDNEMADLFTLSDIYVQCPISDGVTISGMQAMAAGIPLVANNVGEISAILEDGKNGLFVEDADSPESYAEKIDLLLQDDGLRKRMASESRRFAVESHDRKKFLDSFIELLESLV